MRRMMCVVMVSVLSAGVAYADVRAEEKSQVKFEGMLGRMFGLFGGKAAREGIVSTVAVKGDRKATLNENTAQIIDLKEEKIYDVDLKGKSYKVTTFAELRKQIEDARKKAEEQAAKDGGAPAAGKPEQEVDIDFDLKESGQKRAINGFDAREVVMTIAVRQKGKTLEQGGGMVMTTNTWLAPKIAGMNEVAEFDRKYAEKLAGPAMLDAQQAAAMLAMYPMMREAMSRFQAENVKMDGTPVLTVMKVEAVADPSQANASAREERQESRPSGLGGLGGRLGRKILDRNKDDKEAPAAGAANRATVMTMQHEVLKVTPTVAEADVTVPAGFKQK